MNIKPLYVELNGYKTIAVWRDDWQHSRPYRITWQVAACSDDAGTIGHPGHTPGVDCFSTMREAIASAKATAAHNGLKYVGRIH